MRHACAGSPRRLLPEGGPHLSPWPPPPPAPGSGCWGSRDPTPSTWQRVLGVHAQSLSRSRRSLVCTSRFFSRRRDVTIFPRRRRRGPDFRGGELVARTHHREFRRYYMYHTFVFTGARSAPFTKISSRGVCTDLGPRQLPEPVRCACGGSGDPPPAPGTGCWGVRTPTPSTCIWAQMGPPLRKQSAPPPVGVVRCCVVLWPAAPVRECL